MDSSSGFGANGAPYEYAVREATSKLLIFKRVALITAYVLWGLILLVLGATVGKLLVPLLALIPLTIWIFVFLTWRFTQVEYEYSFFSGKLTVARILGGRTRRVLTEVTIREADAIFPYVDANVARAEAWRADTSIFAASGMKAENLYIVLWQDEIKKKRYMLCFEANEKAIKIMKYYNIGAFAR